MIMGMGTLIDVGVILIAGLIGLLLGLKISKKLNQSLMAVLGLMAIASGVKMIGESQEMIVVFISLVLGSLVGEKLGLAEKLKQFSSRSALVTASVLSLVGPLAVVGPMNDGLGKGIDLLIVKAGFDGVSILMLASTMGAGAVLAAGPVLLFQGTITLLASQFNNLITPAMIGSLSGLGGIVILALGLDLLKVKEFKVVNMLPGFLLVPVVTLLLSVFGGI